MPAYLLSLDPEDGYADHEAIARYGAVVPDLVRAFGGEYLLPRRPARVLEGDWDPGPVVLISFASMEKLMAFYDSAEYRPWRESRKVSGATRIVVAEGAG